MLLLAAAICQAGIFAPPDGAPVMNGVMLRPWRDAMASVPELVLTDAGLGVILSSDISRSGLLGVVIELMGVVIEFIGEAAEVLKEAGEGIVAV